MHSTGFQPSTTVQKNTRRLTGLDCGIFVVGGLIVFVLLAMVYFNPTDCTPRPGMGACLRVLFIGNSYTYVNDLPSTFAQLAKSGGHRVKTGMVAEGGWTLDQHMHSSTTLDAIQSGPWDFVVLQEQSEIPALQPSRTSEMYPAARSLVGKIREAGAAPIFFQTWGHQDGDPDYGIASYEAMQAQLDDGLAAIAQELNTPIAPVGAAWFTLRQQNPQLNLWQEDGSHPNMQGTYLAACVFYAVIFRQSPLGLAYTANLPQATAHVLQTTAASLVLNNPK